MIDDKRKALLILPPGGAQAAVAAASEILLARLAAGEDAIAVALGMARDESIIPQARAAALKTVAQLMASASTIGSSLARMNGGTRHTISIERREDSLRPLSTEQSAELRQKLKNNPRKEGNPKIFQAGEEPSPPFRIR